MYKTSSDNAQRMARQLWMRDLVGDTPVEPTAHQKRENLVAQWKALQKELESVPKGQSRKEIGHKLCALQQQISAIRPKMKAPSLLHHYFMEVCQEALPSAQFKRLISEASDRARSSHMTASDDQQNETAQETAQT